jgi:SAM-dependent methyltransferase
LFPGLQTPGIFPDSHFSNPLSQSALSVIAEAGDGLVLNLSAGGTAKRFNNVLEAEAAVFRHTDILVDAHCLPFADSAFEAAVVMNAFEHYREPQQVARELFRVLRPGGKVLVHTAFLQPLHEKPRHFYNCTRYGLEEWFKDFETERLLVSDNFSRVTRSPGWLPNVNSPCPSLLKECGRRIPERFLGPFELPLAWDSRGSFGRRALVCAGPTSAGDSGGNRCRL